MDVICFQALFGGFGVKVPLARPVFDGKMWGCWTFLGGEKLRLLQWLYKM